MQTKHTTLEWGLGVRVDWSSACAIFECDSKLKISSTMNKKDYSFIATTLCPGSLTCVCMSSSSSFTAHCQVWGEGTSGRHIHSVHQHWVIFDFSPNHISHSSLNFCNSCFSFCLFAVCKHGNQKYCKPSKPRAMQEGPGNETGRAWEWDGKGLGMWGYDTWVSQVVQFLESKGLVTRHKVCTLSMLAVRVAIMRLVALCTLACMCEWTLTPLSPLLFQRELNLSLIKTYANHLLKTGVRNVFGKHSIGLHHYM